MTFPRAERDRLILFASLSRSPVALVFFCLSVAFKSMSDAFYKMKSNSPDPAKSIRLNRANLRFVTPSFCVFSCEVLNHNIVFEHSGFQIQPARIM